MKSLVTTALILTTAIAAYFIWDPTSNHSEASSPALSLEGTPSLMNKASENTPLPIPSPALTTAVSRLDRVMDDDPTVDTLPSPEALIKPESFDDWPDAVRQTVSREMAIETLEDVDVKEKKGQLKFEAVGRLPNGMEIELRTDAEGNILERDVDIHPRELPTELLDSALNEIDPKLGDVLVESVEKRHRKNGIHYEVRSKAGPWAFETQVDPEGRILDLKAEYRPTPGEATSSDPSPQP